MHILFEINIRKILKSYDFLKDEYPVRDHIFELIKPIPTNLQPVWFDIHNYVVNLDIPDKPVILSECEKMMNVWLKE